MLCYSSLIRCLVKQLVWLCTSLRPFQSWRFLSKLEARLSQHNSCYPMDLLVLQACPGQHIMESKDGFRDRETHCVTNSFPLLFIFRQLKTISLFLKLSRELFVFRTAQPWASFHSQGKLSVGKKKRKNIQAQKQTLLVANRASLFIQGSRD